MGNFDPKYRYFDILGIYIDGIKIMKYNSIIKERGIYYEISKENFHKSN